MGIWKKFWDVFTEVGIKLMLQKYLDEMVNEMGDFGLGLMVPVQMC